MASDIRSSIGPDRLKVWNRKTGGDLPVVEVFGPTVQGEGALIGQRTLFVRFAGCDYRCSWCDSMHAVEPEQWLQKARWIPPDLIVQSLKQCDNYSGWSPWVTLSGGNPAIQLNEPMEDLVRLLKSCGHPIRNGYKIAVETQGTVWREWLLACDLVTISPKPPSSQMVTDLSKLDRFISRTLSPSVLKIVVADADDYEFARKVHLSWQGIDMYLQPCNTKGHDSKYALLEKLRWLTEKTLKDPTMADVIVLPQLHVLLWGNQLGR